MTQPGSSEEGSGLSASRSALVGGLLGSGERTEERLSSQLVMGLAAAETRTGKKRREEIMRSRLRPESRGLVALMASATAQTGWEAGRSARLPRRSPTLAPKPGGRETRQGLAVRRGSESASESRGREREGDPRVNKHC